jgi:hypothetical protein
VTESTRGAGKNRVISRDGDDDTVGQIADLFSVPPHHLAAVCVQARRRAGDVSAV